MQAAPSYLPAPSYLNSGDTAWQLTAATLVGLQSVPGLAILYGGIVKKKWAINSAMMVFYSFAMVLMVWVLFGFHMGFGEPLKLGSGMLANFVGVPMPVMDAAHELGRAAIPLAAHAMPAMRLPGSALVYFQFVFAAIAPVLIAGAVLGRMNFKAWMIFVPIWSGLVYSVGAFALWGGGWLAQLGAVDFSGGYVIHVAAGVSGFVAAAVIGPRLLADRLDFSPNNLMMSMAGAGLLWLGWNGFNGGGAYYANADAAAAVLNTNIAAACAMLVWMFFDVMATGKPSTVGLINGIITGLVAITPAAGFVNGYGALIIGVLAGSIPWLSLNKLARARFMQRIDDVLGVVHTHGVAGAVGGLAVGLLADPKMVEYLGATGSTAPVAVTGWLYGNPSQFASQALALAFIIGYNAVMTFGILKAIALFVPLRSPMHEAQNGDIAIHGHSLELGPLQPINGRIPEPVAS